MDNNIEKSAVEFAKMWCELFVGENPDIRSAMNFFDEKATIFVPNTPFRIGKADDEEEINFSHLVDGRGQINFWQVIEPQVTCFGDNAIVTYHVRYNIGRKGESVMKYGKETLILVRNKDSWRIAHMHNSV